MLAAFFGDFRSLPYQVTLEFCQCVHDMKHQFAACRGGVNL
jgi:hypothetical protein